MHKVQLLLCMKFEKLLITTYRSMYNLLSTLKFTLPLIYPSLSHLKIPLTLFSLPLSTNLSLSLPLPDSPLPLPLPLYQSSPLYFFLSLSFLFLSIEAYHSLYSVAILQSS